MSTPTTGLKELLDAANESAKREATQWFFFVTLTIYLAIAVGSVTHRKLFLEEPIPLPIFNVALPLSGFFVVAPAIFVGMHLYLLAQINVLVTKLEAALVAARAETGEDGEALSRVLKRIDPFPVAQILAATALKQTEVPLRLMAWATLVVAPLVLLLFVQVRFLPYQDELITWWHRLLVMGDLAVLWWLWPRALGHSFGAAVALSALVFVFAFSFATVRGELIDPLNHRWLISARAWLFDGPPDWTTQRPTGVFSRALVLPNETLITERHAAALSAPWPDAETDSGRPDPLARTLVLRGRSLRGAVLTGADLRRADLTGADLRLARLNGARLRHAILDNARLQGAVLDGADLRGSSLLLAELTRARLANARLEGAFLLSAKLREAVLFRTQLHGAVLDKADLRSASLDFAQLAGASAQAAELQGAVLIYASLPGADLRGATFVGASLRQAQLQGADLRGAQLQGAFLDGADLQGSSLQGANLRGASLRGANAWRAFGTVHLTNADLRNVQFNEPPPDDLSGPRTWRSRIDAWIAAIPNGQVRQQAEARLLVLLQSEDPHGHKVLRQRWADYPVPDPKDVALWLGDLACAEEHPPHVARRIAFQAGLFELLQGVEPRDLGPHRAMLATRLLDVERCPGTRGLSVDERATLREIAVSRR